MRRHADQLWKIPLRFTERRIPDVQADITTNNPGIPVVPEEIMEPDGTYGRLPQWLLWRLEGPRHVQFVHRVAYADHQSS